MGDSFESVNLDDYIVNIKDCLVEYDIKEEKKKNGYTVFKGFIKNSSQAVKIFKRPFSYNELNQKIRFDNLMKAFNQGVVLADNIFIGEEQNKQYFSYVIEPSFKNQSGKTSNSQAKFSRLSDIIQSGDLDTQRRQRLFQNLVISLKCLHQIGEPHYEIFPKNIWIEDNYLVYLRPFKLDKQSSIEKIQKYGNKQLFYSSPETYFEILYGNQFSRNQSKQYGAQTSDQQEQVTLDISSDLWGLGCIFAEMFLNCPPLFANSGFEAQAFSYYLVLGIPEREEAYYVREDHHNQLCDLLIEKAKYDDLPMLKHIMNKVPQKLSEIITSLLEFHPQNRVSCVNILKYAFFQQHIGYSPIFSPQQSKMSGDKMSLFDFSVSQRTNPNLQVQQHSHQNRQGRSNQKQGSHNKNDEINEGISQQGEQYLTQQPQRISNQNYYTQQPQPDNNFIINDKQSQPNSSNKQNNWWNSDFSEQKGNFDNPSNQLDNNHRVGSFIKSSDQKNKILVSDSQIPNKQNDYNQIPINHQSSQHQRSPQMGSNKKDRLDQYDDNNNIIHQVKSRETISKQGNHQNSLNHLQSINNQYSPNSVQQAHNQQIIQQVNPLNNNNLNMMSIQSQRSPDFSVKNGQQQIKNNPSSQDNIYSNRKQDQYPSANKLAHTSSNGNFSCNLTPIPHKVYEPSKNIFEVIQNQKVFDEDGSLEGNNQINIKSNNIFETQKPKFFLSQPQSQKGQIDLQSQYCQIPQQKPYFVNNKMLQNQFDEQSQSYISQNQTNKTAYVDYNERVNQLFGKNIYKQASASSSKGKSIQNYEQNEQQSEDEFSCVIEIKIKYLTNLLPEQSSQGFFNCKVDIPYIEQQCLTLEGDIQFDPKLAFNYKKMIPTQLELSHSFNYKTIKQVLSEQPIQIKLFDSNQSLYAHAFMDLSFNFLVKNPMISDELLWQKPVKQWYHLINPDDANQSYGKIKIETKVVVLKQNKKKNSFIQNKKQASNSFSYGHSAGGTNRQLQNQNNRSYNYGQKRNQSFASINKMSQNGIKKNSSLNNLDNQKSEQQSVLKQIQHDLTILDEQLKEKSIEQPQANHRTRIKDIVLKCNLSAQKKEQNISGNKLDISSQENKNTSNIRGIKGAQSLQQQLKSILNQS